MSWLSEVMKVNPLNPLNLLGGGRGTPSSSAPDTNAADTWQNKAVQSAEQQYNDRLKYRNQADQRFGETPDLAGYTSDYAGSPTYAAITDPLYYQATAAQGKSLADLSNGPDRLAAVRATLADLDAANAPRIQAGVRRIGQDASRLGRLGAQGVGTDIGNFEQSVEADRARQEAQLVRDMTEANQQDKYRTADLAGNIAQSAYGRGAQERGYKDTLSLQDIQNRVNARDRATANNNQRFGQGLSLAGLGYGFDPTAAYQNASNQKQRQSENAQQQRNFDSQQESQGLGSLLGLAGTVAGTLFGGPVGGAIGGSLGSSLGGRRGGGATMQNLGFGGL